MTSIVLKNGGFITRVRTKRYALPYELKLPRKLQFSHMWDTLEIF